MKFENKGKWVKQISESIQKNEDADDMIDVIDDNGNIQFIPLDEYEKHRTYYQNNLTKYANKQMSIKQKQQNLDKFNAIQKKIKEKEQQLKGSYGANADRLDRELSELKKQRDALTRQIYGKTYSELKRR